MLWMITDFTRTPDPQGAFAVIERAVKAGVTHITLRNRGEICEKLYLDLAVRVSATFTQADFFVRDIVVAEYLGIFNFHLPSVSIGLIPAIRDAFPESMIAGSTHSSAEYGRAFRLGADYAFYSPVFTPLSKPGDKRECVRPLKDGRIVLLGGIDRKRAERLIRRGFRNIAGISLFYGRDAQKDIEYLSSLLREENHDSDAD